MAYLKERKMWNGLKEMVQMCMEFIKEYKMYMESLKECKMWNGLKEMV